LDIERVNTSPGPYFPGVERLREHIMQAGHQVPVDGIDRGVLLVHPLEVWREAYTRYMGARMLFGLFTFAILGVGMLLVLSIFIPLIGFVMITIVGLVALSEFAAYRATRRFLAQDGALPGVYSSGVELPVFPVYTSRLFIPWTEMEDAWVKRSRMADDMLFIAVKASRWKWRAPGRLFGQDGMQAVVDRVKGPPPLDLEEPEQPSPRLVLYSAEGAKTESVPEDA
jgi:hypothetical protein